MTIGEVVEQLSDDSKRAMLYMALVMLFERGLATPEDIRCMHELRQGLFRHKVMPKAA